jgi:MFS family permease
MYGWRQAWTGLGGLLLLGFVPLVFLLARSTPEEMGLAVEGPATVQPEPRVDLPLSTALRAPAFWVFSLAAALFNFMWSAITLFNESILAEHGFDKTTFILVMAVLVFSGLPANLAAGWLSTRWSMGRLLAVGMGMLAVSLAVFPQVSTPLAVVAYAAGLGISGGIVTVVFFTVYGHAFGRRHLGSIQAVVQAITVIASALGPLFHVWLKQQMGSSNALFLTGAVVSAMLAVGCWVVKLPPRPLRSAITVSVPGEE